MLMLTRAFALRSNKIASVAAAAPIFRAVGNTSGFYNGASWTAPSLPSGTTAGDMLILTIDTSANSAVSTPTPSGWTLIASVGTITSGTKAFGVYYRIATGSGDAPTIGWDSNGTYAKSVVTGFTGGTGIEASSLTNYATGTAQTNLPYSTLTTLGANRLVVQVFAAFQNGGGMTGGAPDASWTERFERWDTSSSDDTTVAQFLLSLDTMVQVNAGAVAAANRVYSAINTVNANNSMRISFAILP